MGTSGGIGGSAKGMLACNGVRSDNTYRSDGIRQPRAENLSACRVRKGQPYPEDVLSDPEYWHGFSKQERNINKLLTSTISLVEQVEDGTMSIIDLGIDLGHLKRMCTTRAKDHSTFHR